MKLYGTKGRIAVEAAIVGSQFTLVAAYVYFIAGTMQGLVVGVYDKAGYANAEVWSKWIFGAMCLAIYVPLCWVRNMGALASTHLFGDIMIILVVVFIMGYAFTSVGNNGFKT